MIELLDMDRQRKGRIAKFIEREPWYSHKESLVDYLLKFETYLMDEEEERMKR